MTHSLSTEIQEKFSVNNNKNPLIDGEGIYALLLWIFSTNVAAHDDICNVEINSMYINVLISGMECRRHRAYIWFCLCKAL